MLKKTKERGITLISLVITIILLLILATVAISLAVDSDGLFSKAGDAANKWNTSVAEEDRTLQNLIDMADNIGPKDPVSKYVTDEVTGRTVPIPTGYVASQISEESTIAGGLVIYEGTAEVTGAKGSAEHENAMTTRNQYVWIPVDDINDMVMCSVCGGGIKNLVYNDTTKTLTCTSTHETGTTPKLVGKLYVNTRESFSNEDWIFNADTTDQIYFEWSFREPALLSDDEQHYGEEAEAVLEQMQKSFEDMAVSVAKYKGFYISRYEISEDYGSKKGKNPLEGQWYTFYEELSQTRDSITLQLPWGSQYDQIIKFIGEEAEEIHEEWNIISDDVAVTGNNSFDIMQNIFDLEGNNSEWTAEAVQDCNRILRGSAYYWEYEFRQPACGRCGDVPGAGGYSARTALYVNI